ncbi:MAG: hypothetical protein Q8N63_03295, partial [Nanoarchaeota archaeon]|nr:hypothetical protein [Nanoarchaeota archaeon]
MESEDFSEVEKYLLLLLSADSNQPIPGKLWYQKELFMLSKNIPELEEETDFEPYFWGPYSELAEEEMEELRKLDLVEMINTSYKLTPKGEIIAKQISLG